MSEPSPMTQYQLIRYLELNGWDSLQIRLRVGPLGGVLRTVTVVEPVGGEPYVELVATDSNVGENLPLE